MFHWSPFQFPRVFFLFSVLISWRSGPSICIPRTFLSRFITDKFAVVLDASVFCWWTLWYQGEQVVSISKRLTSKAAAFSSGQCCGGLIPFRNSHCRAHLAPVWWGLFPILDPSLTYSYLDPKLFKMGISCCYRLVCGLPWGFLIDQSLHILPTKLFWPIMLIRSVCAWVSFTYNWIISIYHKEVWD